MIVFSASKASLPEIFQWILSSTASLSLAAKEKNVLRVALEEVVANVVLHAYGYAQGEVKIQCSYGHAYAKWIVIDEGKPFNPLLYLPVAQGGKSQSKVEGGLGLKFIDQAMDELSYRRLCGQNIFTLTKKL